MIFKCFLLFCGLCLPFLDGIICSTQVLNFDEVQFLIFGTCALVLYRIDFLMYNVKYGSRFIFFPVDSQLIQHHLQERPLFYRGIFVINQIVINVWVSSLKVSSHLVLVTILMVNCKLKISMVGISWLSSGQDSSLSRQRV